MPLLGVPVDHAVRVGRVQDIEITEDINGIFTDSAMQCSIIAQSVDGNEELKRRAEEQGISVGKMHLIDKMVDAREDLGEEDIKHLTDMSIKELNLMYSDKSEDADNGGEQDKNDDMISGDLGGVVEEESAIDAILKLMSAKPEDVDNFKVKLRPTYDVEEQKYKLFYEITIKFKGELQKYVYRVDCFTGDIQAVEP